jgi:hypothetical protein
VQDIARRYLEGIGLHNAYFDSVGDRCYCKRCYQTNRLDSISEDSRVAGCASGKRQTKMLTFPRRNPQEHYPEHSWYTIIYVAAAACSDDHRRHRLILQYAMHNIFKLKPAIFQVM